MSKGSQIFLGVVFALAAVQFVYFGATNGPTMPAGALPFYSMAVFCAAVAAACLMKASRPITLRIIGATLAGAFAYYAYDSYGTSNFIRALAGFCVIGLPGAYVAVTGNYPKWGESAAVFAKEPTDRESIK